MPVPLSDLARRTLENLRGTCFEFSEWQGTEDWTHDHCQVCSAQIRTHPLEGDFAEGFVTYAAIRAAAVPQVAPGYRIVPQPVDERRAATWICPQCFEQHKKEFAWTRNGQR